MSLMPPRRAGCAVLALALCTTACGGGTGASSHAARSGPAPLDDVAYGTRLARAGDAVQDAIALPRSKDPDALSGDLEDAAKALNDSARALDVTPPAAAGAAHEDLLAGLSGLATAFSSAAEGASSGQVCTAAAALARITRSRAAQDMRAAARALRSAGFEADGLAPAKRRTPSRRLANGAVLGRSGSGPGKLVIRNGAATDGVVKILAGGRKLTIYVRGHHTATATGIADGTYRVYFASGRGWDGARNTFSRSCGFTRFEDTMRFTSPGTMYTRFSITLNAVAGGTARTNKISPHDFPD